MKAGRLVSLALASALVASCGEGDADSGPRRGGVGGEGGAGPSGVCATGTFACGEGCCPCAAAGELVRMKLDVEEPVVAAAAEDLDADGRADLVLAHATGLRAYVAGDCGGFSSSVAVLGDYSISGLTAAQVTPGLPGVLAVTSDGELHGLSGIPPEPAVWGALSFASGIETAIPAHLDTDGDHDVVVFTTAYAGAVRVENTGTGFRERVDVELPPGIHRVVAGDLGGPSRDELLFLGEGLVQVSAPEDFDFSDVRPLWDGPTTAAAIADANGDGRPDAWVASGEELHLWLGDGETGLTADRTIPTSGTIVDLAIAGGPGAPVAFVHDDGTVASLQLSPGGSHAVQTRRMDVPARRILTGDVDADGRPDLLAVGADGSAWVWVTAAP